MSAPRYLIDTNVLIGLEDWGEVSPTFAEFLQLTSRHGVGVFVHAAAIDDIQRDRNLARRNVSLSKASKFQSIAKMSGLTKEFLELHFGNLQRPNDVVDATLLHCLGLGVVDFLATEDRGLHERARRYAPELSGRVLYVADAVSLLRSTYEPVAIPLRYVEEVEANTIPLDDPIFASLRADYSGFDDWWLKKCVRAMRKCWIVVDGGELAGIVVRKEESVPDTDARSAGKKILKVCTFKVKPERRGIKLGELLMKQILWYAQKNRYDVVYLTTYKTQSTLIDLLTFYGFRNTYAKPDGELVYERSMSQSDLRLVENGSLYDLARTNYPKFYSGPEVKPYAVPIREVFHDILFPELVKHDQLHLFALLPNTGPITPGNTIRKVYLCRSNIIIKQPGAVLVFYKGLSSEDPSQAVTTLGIFESMTLASSTEELRRLSGGRSVYSDAQLRAFQADADRPVKVINFLLAGYLDPPMPLKSLVEQQVFKSHPPQSIRSLTHSSLSAILKFGHWSSDAK